MRETRARWAVTQAKQSQLATKPMRHGRDRSHARLSPVRELRAERIVPGKRPRRELSFPSKKERASTAHFQSVTRSWRRRWSVQREFAAIPPSVLATISEF